MKKQRHKTEEIIRIIRKADSGQTVEDVCREENICLQTFYRWRRKYGRMEMADAKRFKELVNENGELKKMLADEMGKDINYEVRASLLRELGGRKSRRGRGPSSLQLSSPPELDRLLRSLVNKNKNPGGGNAAIR